jgi:hypothetical protein
MRSLHNFVTVLHHKSVKERGLDVFHVSKGSCQSDSFSPTQLVKMMNRRAPFRIAIASQKASATQTSLVRVGHRTRGVARRRDDSTGRYPRAKKECRQAYEYLAHGHRGQPYTLGNTKQH